MKKLKFWSLVVLLTVSFIVLLNSCKDDNQALDSFWINFATVKVDDANNSFYFVLDDNTILLPVATGNFEPKEKIRVLLNYTILSDSVPNNIHLIKINGVSEILTSEVKKVDSTDDDKRFGNDPVNVVSAWIGGEYINLRFKFKMHDRKHAISLVENKLAHYPDDGKIHLEFRHNANNDYPFHYAQSYVAFDINPYIRNIAENKSLVFVIHTKEWSDNKTYELITK